MIPDSSKTSQYDFYESKISSFINPWPFFGMFFLPEDFGDSKTKTRNLTTPKMFLLRFLGTQRFMPGSSDRYAGFLPKLVGFLLVNFGTIFFHKRKIQVEWCILMGKNPWHIIWKKHRRPNLSRYFFWEIEEVPFWFGYVSKISHASPENMENKSIGFRRLEKCVSPASLVNVLVLNLVYHRVVSQGVAFPETNSQRPWKMVLGKRSGFLFWGALGLFSANMLVSGRGVQPHVIPQFGISEPFLHCGDSAQNCILAHFEWRKKQRPCLGHRGRGLQEIPWIDFGITGSHIFPVKLMFFVSTAHNLEKIIQVLQVFHLSGASTKSGAWRFLRQRRQHWRVQLVGFWVNLKRGDQCTWTLKKIIIRPDGFNPLIQRRIFFALGGGWLWIHMIFGFGFVFVGWCFLRIGIPW